MRMSANTRFWRVFTQSVDFPTDTNNRLKNQTLYSLPLLRKVAYQASKGVVSSRHRYRIVWQWGIDRNMISRLSKHSACLPASWSLPILPFAAQKMLCGALDGGSRSTLFFQKSYDKLLSIKSHWTSNLHTKPMKGCSKSTSKVRNLVGFWVMVDPAP